LCFLPIFLAFSKWQVILKFLGNSLKICKKLDDVDHNWDLQVYVDENLGTYWQVISESNRKRWFAKEVNLRSRFGIKILDDEQLDKLRYTKTGKKIFSGDFNFDMLGDHKL
jgi:hypothetical protein